MVGTNKKIKIYGKKEQCSLKTLTNTDIMKKYLNVLKLLGFINISKKIQIKVLVRSFDILII